MSQMFGLACVQCQQYLWVGQQGGGMTEPWLYSGRTSISVLTHFLNAHRYHELVFRNTLSLTEYEEVPGVSAVGVNPEGGGQ